MAGEVKLRIAGGMHAVGERNGTIVESEGRAIVIDWGLKIPEFGSMYEDRSIKYLSENHFPDIRQLEGLYPEMLCITHGHTDHSEAWWKLLDRYPELAIATHPFTRNVIRMRAEKGYEKNRIESPSNFDIREYIEAGPFKVHRFPVNHSIPGACGFLIEAGGKRIVQPGDIKSWQVLDGVDRNKEVFGSLLEGGRIDHLFLDATNATESGFVIPEETVEEKIRAELLRSQGWVFFATISSNLRRQESVINAAYELGRPVIVIGSGMRSFLEIGNVDKKKWEPGYQPVLRDTMGNDTGKRQISPNPLHWPEDAVICISGSQGEPLSFLDNWAQGRLHLPGNRNGITLILSQDTIPIDEIEKGVVVTLEAISEYVDEIHLPEAAGKSQEKEFVSRGAAVYRDPAWHATGHGKQGDQKLVLDTTEPTFFTPCHADREKREILAALGEKWGHKAILLEDGDRYIIK